MRKHKKNIKLKELKQKENGITLIALVITVIILLILAGISIATLTGENGVLTKASKAKEESLIKQYEEEINLIIIDEIAERKIQVKKEAFIQSLENKIRQKEWVEETKKCNETGTEQIQVENNNRLIVTTQEGYEIIIEVDNEKLIAKIIDISETGKIEEDNTEESLILNLGITDNKITEGANVSINVTSTRRLQDIKLKAQDVVIYSEENINAKTYNKASIGIEQLKNLDKLPFLDNMTVTLEATTASGTKETKTLENVKNYTISTATQLNKLADVVNGGNNLQNETIVQLADIDVNPGKWTENEDGTTNFQNDATQWQVIGSATYDYDSNSHSNIKSFAGTFNGKQNKIAGVYINNSSRDEVGLFSINEGIIENVILKNSSIKGRYNAGGIASGNSSQAEIRNCTNYASVSGTRCVGGICGWSRETLDNDINYGQISSDSRTGWKLVYETVGGIVGWGDNTITNCKNYGNVSSLTSQRNHEINGVGGIIGGASFGDISNCYNEGNISCIGLDAGGIVGAVPIAERNVIISRCYNNGDITGRVAAGISGWGYYMQIQDCYNRGNIQGSYQSAGITGWTGKNGAIINSYNIGEVTGNGIKWVGGILGRYYDTPTLTNCYHLNTSSANGIGDDNNGWASTTENDWDEHIEVKTDEEMRKLASQLGDNWTEDTSNINNGYPILKWQVE